MLSDRLRGRLVLPNDPDFPFARQLQNKEFDSVTPHAVSYCETPQDVQACLSYAQEEGIQAHVRGNGHSFNGWSTGGGLVIDLSRFNFATAGKLTVRIGGGAQSLDVLAALHPQQRQVVTGTFPTVSAGGFLPGGGLGWQTRRFGLASDRLVSALLVLADGRVVRCSADAEPDLFWAVRGGGGGNFGVALEYEVRPIEAPLLTGFATMWAHENAVSVLTAWQSWCAEGPDDLGTSLVVLPGMFGPYGQPVVRIWGAWHGVPQELDGLLDELSERAGVKPLSREVGQPGPYATVMHDLVCGPDTVAQCHRTGSGPQAHGHRHPYTRQSYRLTGRPASTAESAALLGVWENTPPDQERYLLCMALGGEANRVGRTETAYVHRDARFLIGYQIACRDEERSPQTEEWFTAWTEQCDQALAPLACGSYINFPSSRPAPGWEDDYYGENYPRLQQVKRSYDAGNFFRHAQSIAVALEGRASNGD
jgi:FAD binding domain/Berberine and berberine like